ncbi:hypothetical protein [Paraburkholderia aromaticivorans]|uniref:hypothetical protein n=1 Tax=Paraburkholderia aromaticivorans TaxID=2026199 RepID=UPI0014560777|nr:hypothetical protein [Paraburkholderia aromaticivorans]
MAATERIAMTMRELDRFKVIQDVAEGKLKPWRAAERLRLKPRHISELSGGASCGNGRSLRGERALVPREVTGERYGAARSVGQISQKCEQQSDWGPARHLMR